MQISMKGICAALVAATAAAALAGPAVAGQIVVHATFLPGKLTVERVVAHTSPAHAVRIRVVVADGRGSGAGWTLRFAGKAQTVTAISASCAANSTCTLPAATTAPDGAVVLRAAHGTGMGVIDLVVTVGASASAPVSFSVE
jgi:hypothetical protein